MRLRTCTTALMVLALVTAATAVRAAIVVHAADPMENVLPATAEDLPGEPIDGLTVRAGVGEHEPVALMISDDDADAFGSSYVRVRTLTGDLPARLRPLPEANVTVREVVEVRSRRGPLVGDALPRLNDRSTVCVPAGEARGLWLDLHTRGLDAGEYGLRLRLEPLDGPPAAQCLVRLHVWDIELPRRMPIAVFNWDYGLRGLSGAPARRHFRELVEHGVNAFHVTRVPGPACDAEGELVEEPDFSSLNELIALEKPRARIFLFETWQFRGRPLETESGGTLAYLSDEWLHVFEQWLPAFVAWTRSWGLDYEDWAFYPFDENIGADFVALAREVKRIDPSVLIFTDKLTDAEQMRAAAPYTDIWCPNDGHWDREEFAEGRRIMRESGDPVWFYFCGRHQKAFLPLERYRLMGWKAWDRDMQGATYWNVFGRSGSVWDDFDGGYPDSGSVYEADGSIVPSRRWEAFREGLEDYCYLHLLRRAVMRAEERGVDPTAIARARETLHSASADALSEPSTRCVRTWRWRAAQQILRLEGADR